MSLFGALNTAISGLSSQSTAFGNISNNVANSQSVGYKEVDTNFENYLTVSNASESEPGSVVATPQYQNDIQGTISQSANPLALAISGQGFFAVSQLTGTANGLPTFNPQQYYTRAGDFTKNQSGYLVNSAGQYLNGWTVDPTTGVANQNALAPIQITQTSYNPVATSNVSLSANLPATPTAGSATSTNPLTSQIQVYDALGTAHTINLDWSQNATDDWTVSVSPDGGASIGTADVKFGAASGNSVPSGTIGQIGSTTGTVTAGGFAAGQPATLQFTTNFGSGPQTLTLNLGQYGLATGVTQFAGTTYDQQGLTQNGDPPGTFNGVSMQSNGDVVVNYDNGASQIIAQVPVITFNAADSLQSENGQSFTSTVTSGTPLANAAGVSGAGSLVTGSVENSNVDIAQQFSQLIVAQQAYSANAKVVTTSDQMLQTTINMKT
jgi:flagellar hook protein FlgE